MIELEFENSKLKVNPEEVSEVVRARQEAWHMFFNVTALGQGDMDE